MTRPGPVPGAIVQARLGSTRLPRKVLEPIEGTPMLGRVVERLGRAPGIEKIVLAIPEGKRDEPLADLGRALGVTVFRGPERDVLARYLGAARAHGIDPVVRITSDCPLIDPEVVGATLAAFLDRRQHRDPVDLLANTVPRRWPRGLDTEVVSLAALAELDRVEDDPAVREHVTLGIYRRPDRFRVAGLPAERDLSRLRWTVDTPEDLALVREIYRELLPAHGAGFGWRAVVALLERRPDLAAVNARVRQKEVPP